MDKVTIMLIMIFPHFCYNQVQPIPLIPGTLMLSSSDSLELEPVTLKDGTRVVIRPIHPDDAEDLQDTFQRLSIQSIYLRFLSFKKELTDEEARQLATVDYNSRMAFVAICKENNQEIVVGVARYAILDPSHPETAEAAVVVSDKYQGLGLGKLLLWRLVTYARAKGVQYIRGNLQVGNDRMLLLVKRSGLPHQTRFVDGIWEVNIDLRLPEGEA
jgi:acetyltransferase